MLLRDSIELLEYLSDDCDTQRSNGIDLRGSVLMTSKILQCNFSIVYSFLIIHSRLQKFVAKNIQCNYFLILHYIHYILMNSGSFPGAEIVEPTALDEAAALLHSEGGGEETQPESEEEGEVEEEEEDGQEEESLVQEYPEKVEVRKDATFRRRLLQSAVGEQQEYEGVDSPMGATAEAAEVGATHAGHLRRPLSVSDKDTQHILESLDKLVGPGNTRNKQSRFSQLRARFAAPTNESAATKVSRTVRAGLTKVPEPPPVHVNITWSDLDKEDMELSNEV